MYLFEILYDQNGILLQLTQHHYHQQAEMKVTNSLQQPYSFSLAQQGSFLAEDLPPSSLPRHEKKFHWFFQAAFPHKLVQYPKNISIWHTHFLSMFDTNLWVSYVFTLTPKIWDKSSKK